MLTFTALLKLLPVEGNVSCGCYLVNKLNSDA